MLNRLASLPHFLRVLIEPALHRFQNVFVFPAGDASLLAAGASFLDRAALACVGPVAAQDQSVFFVRPASEPSIFIHARGRMGSQVAAKGLADPLMYLWRIHVVRETRLVLKRFCEDQ